MDGTRHTIALAGTAAAPSPCPPAASCRTWDFNPIVGACEERSAPEGAICSDVCLEGARCSGGQCVGAARDCADDNACTRDACDQSSGCVHVDDTDRCAPPGDPCRAAFCDPDQGCGSRPVPDGTRCGAGDCVTTAVCLAGTCRRVATPEGSVCAPRTLCRGEGRCRSQSCEVGAETQVRELWSYSVPSGNWGLSFPGIVDGDGNIYWVEREGTVEQVDLVSVTAGGLLRYRQTIAIAAPGYFFQGAERNMILAGDLSILAVAGNFVEARSRIDGSRVWRRDLVELVTGGARSSREAAPPKLLVTALLRADDDSVYLVADGKDGNFSCTPIELCGGWILRLSAREGRVIWARSTWPILANAVADAQGRLYYLEFWGTWVVSVGSMGRNAGASMTGVSALSAWCIEIDCSST